MREADSGSSASGAANSGAPGHTVPTGHDGMLSLGEGCYVRPEAVQAVSARGQEPEAGTRVWIAGVEEPFVSRRDVRAILVELRELEESDEGGDDTRRLLEQAAGLLEARITESSIASDSTWGLRARELLHEIEDKLGDRPRGYSQGRLEL